MRSKPGLRTRQPFLTLIILWLALAQCHAGTLKELLLSHDVPIKQFSPLELSASVEGHGSSNAQQVLLAYRQLTGELFAGPLHLLRYNKRTGAVVRSDAGLAGNDLCLGSIESVRFLGSFTLLSTSMSPSAECLLVIGANLHVQHTFYGFGPVEVEPNQVILIEDMVHFAPVHPERVQLADLTTGKTVELYPPQNDPLRARLAREHRKRMPDKKTCALMNDPCRAALFDEGVRSLHADGTGRFAFLALQSASHATQPDMPPTIEVSQAVLYVYKRGSDGWRYCQVEVDAAHIEAVSGFLRSDFSKVANRCVPTSPVIADMSTAWDQQAGADQGGPVEAEPVLQSSAPQGEPTQVEEDPTNAERVG